MNAADLGTLLLMTLAVYLPKALPLLLVADRVAPAIQRWLAYVAPAVLAALVAPAIFAPDRQVGGVLRAETLAFAATFVVAVLTRRMVPSVAAGFLLMVTIVLTRGA